MDIPAQNHHVGSTERVFVAHVNDLNDFYLHPDLFRSLLGKLGQDLYNEYSGSLTKSIGINETLNIGDYCACPSESEDWYRGLIRQLDYNGLATVFKIDYGDVQYVPIQFLRPLQKCFFQPHRLAFHCSLVSLIKPINGWSVNVINEFRSRVSTTFLYAKFINYNEVRDISEVEITEKSSKTSLNTDFEQYQIPRSSIQINDRLLYKYIPMEKLDLIQLNQVRMLYYISPSRFYVYLRDKLNTHTSFQIDLQKAMQNVQMIESPIRYQPVVVQDNHVIYHRAVILDFKSDFSQTTVYYIDIGQREYVSIKNIRPLPEEFRHKPAFAIPCRLYNICPINGNEQSTWKSNDQVHDEFNLVMANNVACKACAIEEQICYDVEIDISKIGDLGSFLFGKNLVSRTTMQRPQQPAFSSGQQSYVRTQLRSTGMTSSIQPQQRSTQQNEYYNNSNNMVQQPTPTRMSNSGLQNSNTQQPSNTLTVTGGSSSTIPTAPLQDGYYIITQVHSAAEFYGYSQGRERDLDTLSKYLEDYYNTTANDSSLSVTFILDGTPCVIQHGDKYHRVIIKHRESESRVLVKLVDRGDEILVDTSELLQLHNGCYSVPAFAQSFRLRGYDESQNSVTITRALKKMILNQRVHITLQGPIIHGFYPVDVTVAENQSVNQILLSGDKNSSITSTVSNNRTSLNQPQYPHVQSQVFSNSSKRNPTVGQDPSGRSDMSQRTNEVLPTVPKILTGGSRTQPGRFGAGNSVPPVASSSNEPTPRFAGFVSRGQQQQQQQQQSQTVDSTAPNSMWKNDQNSRSNFGGGSGVSAPASQQPLGRQQSGPSQFGGNSRGDDISKPPMTNNQNRFPSTNYDNQQPSSEPKRSFGSGYSHDDRSDKQASGNNFQQSNDGNNGNGFRRGAFTNRGGGFSERGGRGGFNDRDTNRNNDENGSQSSGGFSRGRGGGFSDRGGRGGNFPDRPSGNRNQFDDNNQNSTERSQNFNNNRGGSYGGRGGFQNRRDQGENSEGGDFGRRDDRGGGGRRGDGFGSRGRRDDFRDRGDSGIRLSSGGNDSTKTFSNWPNTKTTTMNFDAGDAFIENEIPKEIFKFVISHIENPNDFFIQLKSKGDELSKLSETLQNEYKQSPEKSLSSFKINQACLAKSSDKCWYRAIVLTTGLSKLKVRFIDFGDTTDVDSTTVRQLEKKHCLLPPYAYRCTFKDAEVVENTNTSNFVDKCVDKDFNGKIKSKLSDGKFILESEDCLKLLLEINAIRLKSEIALKPEITLKRIKCNIAHIESGQHLFYIQDDIETTDKIAELVEEENKNAPTLSLDEVKQLKANNMVIAMYEEGPFRAVIKSDNSDENIDVCYVDYGNTDSCLKTSLKKCSEQLSSYSPQAKQCQLYGIALNDIDKAYEQLGNETDSEIEFSIINQKENLLNVLIFIDNQCINETYGYDPASIDNNDTSVDIDDQSSTTTATTVKEQEQEQVPCVDEKQSNDEILSSTESSADASTVEKSEKMESETEATSSKYREGVLTHVEKSKPYVYIQLMPESESIIKQINELIDEIIEENKHNSSYEIGDHVIAQFSEDSGYYRARIESYSTSPQLYTVYFLDFGNIDENVPVDHLYSYSDDLDKIEPQARGYLLDNINPERWTDSVRSLLEEKINDTIAFAYLDKDNSKIHIKFDNENDFYNIQENENNEQVNVSTNNQTKTFTANISATDNDCFYIHILPDANLHVCELEEISQICDREHKTTDKWSMDDLCLVSNDQNQYYRGQIRVIDENKYDVKCIDYGNTLQNVSDDHLYVLPDEQIFKQSPLARECRLHGVSDQNQTKAIEETIKNIQSTERVTINIENDANDQCLYVTLFRENNEIVNDQYRFDNNDTVENENKQESDNDKKNETIFPNPSIATDDDQQLTPATETPQAESTHQQSDTMNVTENNSLSSISNNQTIDFGENDPSTTNTTVQDETNNSISSN